MDFPSLVTAHVFLRPRSAAKDARAEESFYRSHMRPRPRLRPLIPVATTAALVLLLIGVVQG